MALTKISGSILKDPLNLGEVSIGGTLTYEDVTNVDSVGIVTARSGIHIDDSITHIGDTNTKIRFPAADTITAETGGSERLRISSTGNVSIGNNATPDTLLHLQGDTPKLRIESTNTLEASAGTEEIARIEFEATKSSNRNVAASMRVRQDGTWSTVDDWFSPTAIEFYTQDQSGTEITTPRLTINRDGEVGIGTIDPKTTLHVKNGGGSGYTGSYNARTSAIIEGDNVSGTVLSIMSKSSGYSGLFFGDESQEFSGQVQYIHSNNSLRILTGVGERVRINSTGVGIGTTNPSTQLHLSSSTPAIRLTDTDTAGPLHCDIESASGDLYLDTGSVHRDVIITSVGKTNEIARFTGDGSIGLNVTPGTWDNTFKALEGGGNSKHGQLFFQANGDWTTALGSNLYFNSGWKYRHTGAANWFEMKEDRTTFYMADSGSADSAISWLERFRIHSTGYITMPYQVAFFAYCSISNHDLAVGDKFQFDTIPSSGNVAVNSNHTTFGGTNVFDTSTNAFTAPVAGLYSFTVTAYYRRTGDPLTPLVPRVNNTEVTNGNNNVMFFANSDIVDGTTLSGTVILQLAANDAVTVHRRTHGAATSCRFYGPHSHFCGHLIG